MSCKYSKGVYVNQYFILALERMEMRWIVIIEKHLYDNPIKPGNFRHTPPYALNLETDLQVFDWLF